MIDIRRIGCFAKRIKRAIPSHYKSIATNRAEKSKRSALRHAVEDIEQERADRYAVMDGWDEQ